MTDVIRDLDAALAKAGASSDLKEEYPDASDQAIENAKRLHTLTREIKSIANKIANQQKARQRSGPDPLPEIKTQVAALAVQVGRATDEEKQRVKQARAAAAAEENSALSDLGKIFDPSSGSTTNP
jgi:chromosome segregation ATPase